MTDALRGPNDTAFHGCHHNLQVAAAMGAALTLSRYMEAHALNGTIALISYPAEEIPPPTINAVRYTFTGRSVSANVQTKNLKSTREQGSALEAVLQFFQNVKEVRQQVKPEAIIQGVIAEGGEAPNVIPRQTVADFFIRYPVDRPVRRDQCAGGEGAAQGRDDQPVGARRQHQHADLQRDPRSLARDGRRQHRADGP